MCFYFRDEFDDFGVDLPARDFGDYLRNLLVLLKNL